MGQRNKKKDRVKKPKPGPPPLRTKEERQAEVKTIINKLTELNLTTSHSAVVDLMSVMREYVNDGEEKSIDIPFPAVGRRIVGKLTAYVNEQVWVKLTTIE